MGRNIVRKGAGFGGNGIVEGFKVREYVVEKGGGGVRQ